MFSGSAILPGKMDNIRFRLKNQNLENLTNSKKNSKSGIQHSSSIGFGLGLDNTQPNTECDNLGFDKCEESVFEVVNGFGI